MRFRIATASAFAVGFVLGSRRSKDRTLRLVGPSGSGSSSTPPVPIRSKARAVVLLGFERMRDHVGVRLGWRDGDEAAEALILEMTGDLAAALNTHRRIPA